MKPENETRRTVTVVVEVPVTYFAEHDLTYGPPGWDVDELITKLGFRVARAAEAKAQSDWDHEEMAAEREERRRFLMVDLT